jgi:hypothetical protein
VPKDLLKLTATVVDKATGSPAGIQRWGTSPARALVGWKQAGAFRAAPHRKSSDRETRASALPLHGGPEFIQASIPAWADFSSTPPMKVRAAKSQSAFSPADFRVSNRHQRGSYRR